MLCALAVAAGCGEGADALLCGGESCRWSRHEWGVLASMADLPERPPTDLSNRYQGNPAAEQLGQRFFFDSRFSGVATQVDVLRRPVPYARSAEGQPVALSCASCHDGARAGIDTSSVPGHVSVGAGWFDVNAQPTVNSAYYELAFWNGRADSMWAQALLATEGGVAMNGTRLAAAWTIADLYRDDYQAVFSMYPLPMEGASSAVRSMVETEGPKLGQCKAEGSGGCPNACRQAEDGSCWPRFPLAGKPGSKAGCQGGDPAEPAGDAWDCMAKEDQEAVLRVFVNYGKAVAAYEALLVSRNAPFDRFVREGADSTAISASARRGAHLFVGKAACSDCHGTALLSDNKFHDIGVPQVGAAVPTVGDCPAGGVCDCVEAPATTAGDGTPVPAKEVNNCLPWGGRDGLAKLRKNGFRRDSVWSDDPTDSSRKRWVDGGPDMAARGAWRTPSLRDVALTAPYMHDGVYRTLDEVVAHYARGGTADAVGGHAPEIRPLFLDDQEQADLVEFLKTLTGEALPLELRKAPALP